MARIRKYEVEENEKTIKENKKPTEYSPAKVEKNGPETINGIATTLVNVRQTPSYESNVIGLVEKDENVEILSKSKEFYKVKTRENKIGYISSNFIKEG